MKKDYKILSDKFCECGCGKRLKQNLIDRSPDAKFIYKHNPECKKNRVQGDYRNFGRYTKTTKS